MNEPTDTVEILHVDDDPDLCSLTVSFLEREDEQFTVTTATRADEGLAILDAQEIDCVVSDSNMPSMDGLELLHAVREEYPGLPFILFTGEGSEAVASNAIAAGVTDYIRKGSGSERYELLANRIRNAVRARREARRADRQEQLMRLTEFAGNTGGFEVNTETSEVLLTDGARRLLALPESPDLTVENGLEQFHPDDRSEIRQAIDQATETGAQTCDTWRYQPSDGEWRVLEVTFTPPATDGDSAILRGAIHDVTDRRERRRELETERRFIQQALDTLEDLFYVLDVDGSLRRWNEQVPDVTGYTEAELADMRAVDFFAEYERETVADAIAAAVSGERVTIEVDLRTADGRQIPYEFTGARLTTETNDTTGLVGIGRDLTER